MSQVFRVEPQAKRGESKLKAELAKIYGEFIASLRLERG